MRLQQVLLNFQSNALKFTPDDGQVEIRCSLELIEGEPDAVRLQVIDNGVGISEADQAKLFKLFGFIQNTRETLNTQGIGMGLYISQQIVE